MTQIVQNGMSLQKQLQGENTEILEDKLVRSETEPLLDQNNMRSAKFDDVCLANGDSSASEEKSVSREKQLPRRDKEKKKGRRVDELKHQAGSLHSDGNTEYSHSETGLSIFCHSILAGCTAIHKCMVEYTLKNFFVSLFIF